MWELAAACGAGRRAWLPGCLRTALSLGPAAPPANTQDGSRGVMTNVRTHPAGIHGCTGWARLARGSPVAIPTPPHPGQQSRWGQSLRPRSAGRRDQERVVRKVRKSRSKGILVFPESNAQTQARPVQPRPPSLGPRCFRLFPGRARGYLAWASCRSGALQAAGRSDQAGSSCCSGVRRG